MTYGALNFACEETIVDYLIATLDPMQLTASYYTGVGNVEDLVAPAVMVSAADGDEVIYKSNIWSLYVNIAVKEMAADTNSGSLGILAHTIQNLFWNQTPGTNVLAQSLNATGSHNFVAWETQNLNNRHSVNGDALINELQVRVIGTFWTGSVF